MAYRVGYTIPVQGFRPPTNPGKAAGLLGLGGMGDSNTFSGCVSAMDANGNPVSCSDPSAAVWFDANMNAVAPGAPAAAGSAAVPDGSVVVYQGRWTSIGSLASSGIMPVVRAVEGAIKASGLATRNEQVTQASLAAKLGISSGVPFDIVLTIQVQTGLGGFGNPSDVASIVDHAVYQATGQMPLASSITSVQVPGGGAQSTGQPGLPSVVQLQTPQTLSTWFESNAWWIGVLIVGAVVLPKVL
jgi:hypothetical protein